MNSVHVISEKAETLSNGYSDVELGISGKLQRIFNLLMYWRNEMQNSKKAYLPWKILLCASTKRRMASTIEQDMEVRKIFFLNTWISSIK